MDEVENQVAVQEIAPPETSPQEESPKQEAQAPQIDERQDRNWREMRRINSELERKVKMQEEMMAQLLQRGASTPPPSQPIDELDSIPDDDYIPKGQVKKLIKKAEERAEKIAQEAVQKSLQEREKSQFADRLRSKFTDFDDVVNPETLELLEQQDPELAKTIASSGDPYAMALQSYKFIKSMGIAEKAPVARRAKEIDRKIEQNAKTVQSPQAFDKRPMAQTFRMTETQKKALFEEMNSYASLAGGVPKIS